MPTDIDRKLCLTAAWLGVATRKELAAAFRRINPETSFDVQRAHKWLQGRAAPRGWQVYEDWAKLVALDQPAEWLADCSVDVFLQRLCDRHGAIRDTLLRRAEAFGVASRNHEGRSRELELRGSYACYSHAWSPYYGGRMVRGLFVIGMASGAPRLHGAYSENLPTGQLHLDGPVTGGERVLTAQLGNAQTFTQLVLWLFMPTPPMSVLGGFMTGTTFLSPQPQLSTSRLIMIRLPPDGLSVESADAYLAPGASIATDLALLGLTLESPGLVDLAIDSYLTGGRGPGLDQVTAADLREVVELFDRQRLDFNRDERPLRASPVDAAQR